MKFFFLGIMLLFTTPLMAQSVSLAWDLSISDSFLGAAGGYRIYQSKTSGTYTTPIATVAPGISTVTFATGQLGRLYWVGRAFESGGIESDNSNEVTDVIKPKPPKLNTVQQIAKVLTAPAEGIVKLANMLKSKKSLKILNAS